MKASQLIEILQLTIDHVGDSEVVVGDSAPNVLNKDQINSEPTETLKENFITLNDVDTEQVLWLG
jgi:hypothetical protein